MMKPSTSHTVVHGDHWPGLERSVRALAQEAVVQDALFPAFVCVPDQLALDFEEHFKAFMEGDAVRLLTSDQARLLNELDDTLASMSGATNAEMWTDQALRTNSRWREVRVSARRLVEAMGWSAEPPQSEDGAYWECE